MVCCANIWHTQIHVQKKLGVFNVKPGGHITTIRFQGVRLG